jgi:hypothetical protein
MLLVFDDILPLLLGIKQTSKQIKNPEEFPTLNTNET